MVKLLRIVFIYYELLIFIPFPLGILLNFVPMMFLMQSVKLRYQTINFQGGGPFRRRRLGAADSAPPIWFWTTGHRAVSAPDIWAPIRNFFFYFEL